MISFFFGSKKYFRGDRNLQVQKFKSCREILNEIKYDIDRSTFLYPKYNFKGITHNLNVRKISFLPAMFQECKEQVAREQINNTIEDSLEDGLLEIGKVFSKIEFTKDDILVTTVRDGKVLSMMDIVKYMKQKTDLAE